MSVRIVCEHCSGELQVPDDSAGSKVRCPFCERIFICPLAFVSVGAVARPSSALDDSSTWTPRQEELLDESVPWYLLLIALAPLSILTFIAIEPIAIGMASVLTLIGLVVATRRSWLILSRLTAIFALALVAMSAAAVAHGFGQGSLANLRRPVVSPPSAPVTPDPMGPDLEQAEWKPWTMPKGDGFSSDVTLLAPGELVHRKVPEFNHGLDVHVFLLNFPKQKVKFALQTFDVATPQNPTESAETRGLTLIRHVLMNMLPETDPDPEQFERPLYCGQHPGYEEQRIILGTTKRIVLNAYLVRDRAYVLSVGAEKFETVKPLADKFFASMQLTKPVAPMRAGMDELPDAKLIPLPTPRASLCGHWKSSTISELSFSADGGSLVTGMPADQIVLWDMKTCLGKFLTSTSTFNAFAVSPTGKHLVTPVPNGLNAPEFVRFPLLKDWPAPPLAFHNSDIVAFKGDKVIVALDTNITGWNGEPGEKFGDQLWESPRASQSSIVSVTISREGRLMATASAGEPLIKLWDTSKNGSPTAVKEWTAHKKSTDDYVPIQQLAFSSPGPGSGPPDLASAGADGEVKIWSLADVNNPKLLLTLLHDSTVGCVDFSADGQRLATGDSFGVVRVWQRSSGKLLHEFRASQAARPVHAVRFSPDDSLLACAVSLGNQRSGVNVFDTKSLPAVANPQTEEPPLAK